MRYIELVAKDPNGSEDTLRVHVLSTRPPVAMYETSEGTVLIFDGSNADNNLLVEESPDDIMAVFGIHKVGELQ